ncbi:dynein light chain Tctex-type protein 2B-like [Adelges cooleyi]|uniref:dynein light chain Tctex-type protein 2B-like n=1 Tax=Adelges cooleyi TaxID=133065 RepID=UPI00217F8C4E|nr:dynein light chain Tctex-type protein 2B-like [Adelges cooleyi]XP_050423337.1 dynein light chain Tctex-type protein 2B-like [Adelges cooleyi]XP_050435447.1 dynein light chain Tctex-type protein 2B-like [Adelges cooleyi]XP_050435449.1 dynein light chain Tctex-type protein 2B-like [Adelges cooleyi]
MTTAETEKIFAGKPNWEYDHRRADESLQSLGGFRVRPRLRDAFNERLVRTAVQTVHSDYLAGKTWEDLDHKVTCRAVVRDVERRVKEICDDTRPAGSRYKIIAHTFIGAHRWQSVTIGMRCLWDEKTDRLVHENYRNAELFCTTQVVAVYYY